MDGLPYEERMLSERATFNRLVHDYAERKQAEYVRVRSEVPRLRGAGVLYGPSLVDSQLTLPGEKKRSCR